MTNFLHVAVGVVVDDIGRVLISKRAISSHQGGLWEFPGGKLEAGENAQQALVRELQEEIGISVKQVNCVPLTQIQHHYADRSVLLDVWSISKFEGHASGREGQAIKWTPIDELDPDAFPVANRKIITLLKLPDRIGITGDAKDQREFYSRLESMLSKGIALVQFRQHSLDDAEYLRWSKLALGLCERYRARLMVNTRPELFPNTSAHGLHLSSARLMALDIRPVASEYLVSAACHNKEQLDHAEKLGVDFALLSPVLATPTHRMSNPLGWQGFSAAVVATRFPVFALGGMTPTLLPQVRQAGGYGIAGISAFWPDSD